MRLTDTPPHPRTDAEKTTQKQIDIMQEQIAAMNATIRRPILINASEGEKYPTCPYCDSEELRYTEDTTIDRHIHTVNGAGELQISGVYSVDDEGPQQGYITCMDCFEESAIPAGLEIEWT
jgi:hypothetical protein